MFKSGILIGGELISEDKWNRHIDSLKTSVKSGKKELKEKLVEFVSKRIPKKKFGIFFSGGVDSSLIALICKQQKADFVCYAVGIEGASDIEAAKKAAKLIGINLRYRIISLKEAEKAVKNVTEIVGPDVMKVGVGAVVYLAAEIAKKDKIKTFFSGLGSEEIFAGYERHSKSEDINEECWKGLKSMYQRDFMRDFPIAEELKIEILTPFLDSDLIKTAMQIPGEQKISKEHKKVVLREAAEEIGLAKEIAWRKKKAAQYGSGLQKAMRRLAKKSGFKMIPRYLFKFYKPRNMRLGALVSSGKDSMYAMYTMMKRNYEIGCMITLRSENLDSFMFHTAAIEMAEMQSKATGIPILEHSTKGEKEKELKDLKDAIEKAKKQYKIKGIVTGALHSQYQKERIEKIAKELGLEIFSPLWHVNQEKYMRDLTSSGFKFILTKISAEGLDKSWLNRVITEKDVEKLVEIDRKIGINIAFEGGEAESLMIDGPIFKKAIQITDSEIDEESKIIATLKIKKAELVKTS
ncbi:diphthine--ammonia ligase [Candidatus Woesearchaeota archaeon]|nr:diphthine--ammonia ligase [Candidatus Woesearchaeota archaeon]